MQAATVIPFDFDEQAVRVIMRDGEPWFVAADVCRVLEIGNSRDAVSRLDDDERLEINPRDLSVGNTDDQDLNVGNTDFQVFGHGGARRMIIISESGLYALIFTSRKEQAKRFRKWVTSDVLPSLRREGRYEMPQAGAGGVGEDDLPLRDAMHWLSAIRETRHIYGRKAAMRLWEQSPLPQVTETQVQAGATVSADLEAFFADCFMVTGNPADRVSAAQMWDVYRRWVILADAAPMVEFGFYRAVAAMAGVWRCPKSRQRFTGMKSSARIYVGICMA